MLRFRVGDLDDRTPIKRSINNVSKLSMALIWPKINGVSWWWTIGYFGVLKSKPFIQNYVRCESPMVTGENPQGFAQGSHPRKSPKEKRVKPHPPNDPEPWHVEHPSRGSRRHSDCRCCSLAEMRCCYSLGSYLLAKYPLESSKWLSSPWWFQWDLIVGWIIVPQVHLNI